MSADAGRGRTARDGAALTPPLAPRPDVMAPRSSGTIAWWGTVLALVAAISLHVTFVFSRVYLVGLGEHELEVPLPALASALLLASSAPAGWAHRQVRQDRPPGPAVAAILLALALAVAHAVMLVLWYADQSLDVQSSVEDATVLVLVGFHLTLLAVVAGSLLVSAASAANTDPRTASARLRSSVQAGTLAWHVMVALWLLSAVVLLLLPRLS